MTRLKNELKKLQRENSRLKKQLNRLGDESEETIDPEQVIETLDEDEVEQQPNNNPCDKCRGEAKVVAFDQFRYKWCESCGHRQKIK